MSPDDFVRAQTRVSSVPGVPDLRLHLAEDAFELWERSGVEPPPFWAFPWAGGLALARHLAVAPDLVTGRTVVDLGAGSGLVAIAAARAGAAAVTAVEIDEYALAAIGLNAAANGVAVTVRAASLAAVELGAPDVVLAGDLWYERDLAAEATAALDRVRANGATVYLGDLGRRYLPRQRLRPLASYEVPVPRSLEDADTKLSTVWSLD